MNFQKYLRQEQIKKDATEAASKSVNEIFGKMMKSEFESLEDVRDVLEDHKNIYFASKSNMYAAKKEETEDSVSYPSWEVTYLNGAWYAYQHQQSKVDELTKQRDSFIKAYEIEIDKSDELQKRVDAAKQLIEDLNKCYQQDHQNKFEYWRGFADSAGILGKRLEQALKGGEDASN